ncbi:MAG TPA: TIGR03435 family protein [Bryobacteraceae bacterium]|jgi:uncharacterized protein (TIGR03435 family)
MRSIHRIAPFALLLLLPPAASGQSSRRPDFEVASVKEDLTLGGHRDMGVRHGHIAIEKMTLVTLISAAYDIEHYQITGGPDWTRTARYNISATAPHDVSTDSFDWWRPMLRSLLADRFRLVLRHETKQMPVYNLIPAKGEIKIRLITDGSCIVADPQRPAQPLPADQTERRCNTLVYTRTSLDATGIKMPRLAYTLAAMLHRFVFDRTGFTGMFDLHMDYAPLDNLDGDSASISSAPSIFTVLQEQLGLKLQSAEGPVDIVVIDHAERPTAN